MERFDFGGTCKFVKIPSGTFLMGAADDEKGRCEDEGPRHLVTLTKPFYLAITPVTQKQFFSVMRRDPSKFKGDGLPVENVSWVAAGKFCLKLSHKLNQRVRLPTEAEWEHACRVGSMTPHSFGGDVRKIDDYAWHWGNSEGTTHPVGAKKPNELGLYDMHGNVCEWCRDRYADHYPDGPRRDPKGPETGKARVLRGGCWAYDAESCRSAYRDYCPSDSHSSYNGFRIALHPE